MTEKEITKLLKNRYADLKTLEEKLSLSTPEQEEALKDTLERMIDAGIVYRHDKSYSLLADQHILLCKITSKANNFVILRSIPDGFECKVSGREADGLLVGDLVYAKEFQEGVFHCLEYRKAVDTLKGYYSLSKSGKEQLTVPYLNECGKTVLIQGKKEGAEDVRQGDLCQAKIVNVNRDFIYVEIESVLVRADDVGSDISGIIAMNDAPLSFPSKVLDEAKSIPSKVSKEELEGRTDFRDHIVVTIDGDDAHDFDDAVEGRRVLNGYEIVVHIADVTHYVRPNHPLDDEARARGTSIYVADRVVPMLPFELSNGICSLNPGVDRLTLSVTMQVDAMGHVFDAKIERGVINSKGRLTYNKVNAFFKGEACDYSKEIQETLTILKEASDKIRRRRTLQGAMQLESTELKFHLDENGQPTDVTKCVQGESEKMIEDLMIIANCAVARALKKANAPVLYRIHEFPPMAKISVFRDYLKKMNLLASFPRTADISGARLNDFLASIKDGNLRSAVSYMMLRSMAKARYSPEEKGHFGLAEMDYCHFTSPIRRYPDDIIHRLVKDFILDQKPCDYESEYARLEGLGESLTALEIRADQIERDVDDLESAKYMSQHIGELYHGKVVSMLRRGMFVETDLGIEGFLSYRCMHGDLFHYDEKSFAVFGRRTDITFTVGTPIDIKVLAVNTAEGQIDFATPVFYDTYAVDLSEKERENLSLNGIHVLGSDEEPEPMTGHPTFTSRSNKPRFTSKDRDGRDFHGEGKRRTFGSPEEGKGEAFEEEHYVDKSKAGFTFKKKEEKTEERRFDRKDRPERREKERKQPSFKGYASYKYKDGTDSRRKPFDRDHKPSFGHKDGERTFDRKGSYGHKDADRGFDRKKSFDHKRPYGHKSGFDRKGSSSYGRGEGRSYGKKPFKKDFDRPSKGRFDRRGPKKRG